MSTDAYQKSTEHITSKMPKLTRAQALSAVRRPALGLLVASGLALGLAAAAMLGTVGYLGAKMFAPDDGNLVQAAPDPTETKEARTARKKVEQLLLAENNFVSLSTAFIVATSLVLLNSIVLSGAIKMRKMQRHRSAVAGAAIAIIPVLSPLLILGIPFGIWAMIKLSDPEIKRYFTN